MISNGDSICKLSSTRRSLKFRCRTRKVFRCSVVQDAGVSFISFLVIETESRRTLRTPRLLLLLSNKLLPSTPALPCLFRHFGPLGCRKRSNLIGCARTRDALLKPGTTYYVTHLIICSWPPELLNLHKVSWGLRET